MNRLPMAESRRLGNALDDLAEERLVLATGRRGARDEVEQLAVLPGRNWQYAPPCRSLLK